MMHFPHDRAHTHSITNSSQNLLDLASPNFLFISSISLVAVQHAPPAHAHTRANTHTNTIIITVLISMMSQLYPHGTQCGRSTYLFLVTLNWVAMTTSAILTANHDPTSIKITNHGQTQKEDPSCTACITVVHSSRDITLRQKKLIEEYSVGTGWAGLLSTYRCYNHGELT